MKLEKGIVIQFTGFSGAGKSTLAAEIKPQLESQGYKVAVVDGDVYRKTLCNDLGFSKSDRVENIRRLGVFSESFVESHDVVIIAAINPYEEARSELKLRYDAKLVYLDCPLAVLIERDPKGLYQKAMLAADDPNHIAHFTGVSHPYEKPEYADLTLDTGSFTVEESSQKLFNWILNLLSKEGNGKELVNFLHQFRKGVMLGPDQKSQDPIFIRACRIFRAIFDLNVSELYGFLFSECKGDDHFQSWLTNRLGDEGYRTAAAQFITWKRETLMSTESYVNQILTDEQFIFWQEKGYLKISGLLTSDACTSARNRICKELDVQLDNPSTWCPRDSRWEGIMLHAIKGKEIEDIKRHPAIRTVFEDLHGTKKLFPISSPLGYMPPVFTGVEFRGSPLHWDIDISSGPRKHIQALVYLNDVTEDGGAFSLIPGYHKQYDKLLMQYGSLQAAMEAIRNQGLETKIAGKTGDLILWMETMPHAATPNEGSVPRFVQYIGFEH